MSRLKTPNTFRKTIAIIGKTNVGKSSLINALAGQDIALVSPIQGTTTDPVSRHMELLPFGPVTFIDTPGFADKSVLGQKRLERTLKVIGRADLILYVMAKDIEFTTTDLQTLETIRSQNPKVVLVLNKSDLESELATDSLTFADSIIPTSIHSHQSIVRLKETIIKVLSEHEDSPKAVTTGLFKANDLVIMVTPIDSSAPKGRLILPQQIVLREILDVSAVALVIQPDALATTLDSLKHKPNLVITDSQVFKQVASILPHTIPLTSFSILFARHNGFLDIAVEGAKAISCLSPLSHVLIAEGCTHHRQCEDIGTVKLPKLLENRIGFMPQLEFCSGTDFPTELNKYDLIIHCGGCMQPPAEVRRRFRLAKESHVPFTNYGITISFLTDTLERSLNPLK